MMNCKHALKNSRLKIILVACLTCSLPTLCCGSSTTSVGDPTNSINNPDTYHFSGDLDLNSDLSIDGPVIIVVDGNLNIGDHNFNVGPNGSVQIYVKGDISVSGSGGFSNTNAPNTLLIYGTAQTSQDFSINSNGFLSAAVYAPNANVTSNGGGPGGGINGSIVANTITFDSNSGPFNFDEDLLNLTPPDINYTLNYYRYVKGNHRHIDDDSSKPTYQEFMDSFF